MSKRNTAIIVGLILFLLIVGVVMSSLSSGIDETDSIETAAITGLETIGWDIEGFQAKLVERESNYARVEIQSSNPPGGFTAIMENQNGEWSVVLHGSAINPAELARLGIPQSIVAE